MLARLPRRRPGAGHRRAPPSATARSTSTRPTAGATTSPRTAGADAGSRCAAALSRLRRHDLARGQDPRRRGNTVKTAGPERAMPQLTGGAATGSPTCETAAPAAVADRHGDRSRPTLVTTYRRTTLYLPGRADHRAPPPPRPAASPSTPTSRFTTTGPRAGSDAPGSWSSRPSLRPAPCALDRLLWRLATGPVSLEVRHRAGRAATGIARPQVASDPAPTPGPDVRSDLSPTTHPGGSAMKPPPDHHRVRRRRHRPDPPRAESARHLQLQRGSAVAAYATASESPPPASPTTAHPRRRRRRRLRRIAGRRHHPHRPAPPPPVTR